MDCVCVCVRERERERERERDRQTDRQTERERERERQTDRQRERERDGSDVIHCRAKIGDEFTLSLANNSHLAMSLHFPCQKFTLFVSFFFPLPVSPFLKWSSLWH